MLVLLVCTYMFVQQVHVRTYVCIYICTHACMQLARRNSVPPAKAPPDLAEESN
eukprot:m.463464 g.463464  ORF g.463464 m.463464 type:complete len:54 (+) comp21611_c0_seq3:279-440(+)